MKIRLVRITNAEKRECWMCGEPLWHEPLSHYVRSVGEYVTDPYQRAFRLDAETIRWHQMLCDGCSYSDAETLQEHFNQEIQHLTRQAERLRQIACESLISPSDDDRMREDSIIQRWNEP